MNIELTWYIDKQQNIWFKGKEIASLLGYQDTDKAIRQHVDEDYRKEYPAKMAGYSKVGKAGCFISEPEFYQLIFSSKFIKWVVSIVLPSIRKYGFYKLYDNPNNYMIKIGNEQELDSKVVDYRTNSYPDALLITQMGDLQDSDAKRIDACRKGYQKGSPDLIIGDYALNSNCRQTIIKYQKHKKRWKWNIKRMVTSWLYQTIMTKFAQQLLMIWNLFAFLVNSAIWHWKLKEH